MNRPVSECETLDTIIRVWQIDTPDDREYNYYLCRGWQEALTFLKNHAEQYLESVMHYEIEEQSVSMTMKLVEMTLREYEEATEKE
jgi:hypothetical protein